MTTLYSNLAMTTLEKRFKIPSSVTGELHTHLRSFNQSCLLHCAKLACHAHPGFVSSGGEVSQILLSLVLSYMGGQHNRPRWIAWGGAMSAVACLVMGGSRMYFGPGDDAIQLTEEYLYRNNLPRNLVYKIDKYIPIF